jgi:hypothetical protein
MCICWFFYTECPTRYRNRHFFNNSNTNEDIATKFEQEYVRCVRNEDECVCSVCLFCCNTFIDVRIIKEMPGLIANGTLCIFRAIYKAKNLKVFLYPRILISEIAWLCERSQSSPARPSDESSLG